MFVANTAASLYVFRRPLITRLIAHGVRVTCVCPDSHDISKLIALGVAHIPLNMSRHGVAVGENVKTLLSLYRIIYAQKPDILHAFAHKAVILCGLVRLVLHNTSFFATITGLGTIFLKDGWKFRLLRWITASLYFFVFRRIEKCFFQNQDDLDYFVGLKLLSRERCILTFGSGVELARVVPREHSGNREVTPTKLSEQRGGPENSRRNLSVQGKLKVLLVARPVSEKGVEEFYRAAAVCNALSPGHFHFLHAGTMSESDDLFDWIATEGSRMPVSQLGFVEDMYALYGGVDVVVLPSYREGSPMSLAEACASGKCILASDVPGCRNAVIPGWNGLLFAPKCVHSLVAAILNVTSFDLVQTSMRSVGLAKIRFDADMVWKTTAAAYKIEVEA